MANGNRISIYYSDALKNPILTKQEQLELIQLYKDTGDTRHRDKLLNCNMRFVYKIVSKFNYRSPNVSIDDLMTVGCLGFIHAIDRFDPSYGASLLTYAKDWVKTFIRIEINEGSSLVRVPASSMIKRNKIHRLLKEDDKLSNKEIAEKLDMSLRTVKNLRDVGNSVSIDGAMIDGCEDFNLLSVMENEDTNHKKYIKDELYEYIVEKISHLRERSAFIMEKRFGLNDKEPMTLEEIANKLKISRERVRQIESRAILEIRNMIKEDGRDAQDILALLKKDNKF